MKLNLIKSCLYSARTDKLLGGMGNIPASNLGGPGFRYRPETSYPN
jgi:hypothetical protein